MVRCAKETNGVRNWDNAVWQSAATETDQDDLAVASTRSRLVQAGAQFRGSQSPTPVGRASVGDDGIGWPTNCKSQSAKV